MSNVLIFTLQSPRRRKKGVGLFEEAVPENFPNLGRKLTITGSTESSK